MTRYINADKLMKSMYHRAFETDGDTMWQSGCWVRYRAIEQTVKEQPTADVRENVRARWTYDENNNFVCSNCGNSVSFTAIDGGWTLGRFCQTCGADMRQRGDENEIN